MSYKLKFKTVALKEWKKLDRTIQLQFKKKLSERLKAPHVESAALRQLPNCYKIKLKNAGYRLVYQVHDKEIVVEVIAVGKRERNHAYKTAMKRL